MRTHQLSQATDVSKDTLRYYETIGLISKPLRNSNGYRFYSEQHVREIKFIKYAKSVGFELNQIKLAIPQLNNPTPDCPLLFKAVTEQLAQIEHTIQELEHAKLTLSKWISPHDNTNRTYTASAGKRISFNNGSDS